MIKNIIIVYDQAYYSGGAAKIAIDSAIELSKKYNVYYFFAVKEPVEKKLIDSNVKLYCCNQVHIGDTRSMIALYKGLWNKETYKQMNNFLKKFDNKDTVVHVHGWTKALTSSIFKAIYKNKFHCLITLHEYFLVCENGGLYNYKKNSICMLNSNCLKCKIINCDKKNYLFKVYRNIREIRQKKIIKKLKPSCIYISEFSKKIIKYRLYFRPHNEYFVSNFIDFDDNIKDRVKVEQNEYYVFMGRLSNEKGLDIFCESITNINKKAIVIGDGPLLTKYKNEYSNINFVGWKEGKEKQELLKKARAIIVPSKWYETMGLIVLEAMVLGIPSIVSSQSVTSEYVRNGITGLLFSIKNNDLSEKIKILDDNLILSKMSKNCYEEFDRDFYSLRNHTLKLEEVYNKELSDNNE